MCFIFSISSHTCQCACAQRPGLLHASHSGWLMSPACHALPFRHFCGILTKSLLYLLCSVCFFVFFVVVNLPSFSNAMAGHLWIKPAEVPHPLPRLEADAHASRIAGWQCAHILGDMCLIKRVSYSLASGCRQCSVVVVPLNQPLRVCCRFHKAS